MSYVKPFGPGTLSVKVDGKEIAKTEDFQVTITDGTTWLPLDGSVKAGDFKKAWEHPRAHASDMSDAVRYGIERISKSIEHDMFGAPVDLETAKSSELDKFGEMVGISRLPFETDAEFRKRVGLSSLTDHGSLDDIKKALSVSLDSYAGKPITEDLKDEMANVSRAILRHLLPAGVDAKVEVTMKGHVADLTIQLNESMMNSPIFTINLDGIGQPVDEYDFLDDLRSI